LVATGGYVMRVDQPKMFVSGGKVEASISKAVLVGVFTSSLTLALLTVHVLDFPFESALQLSSRDFNETLEKVDHLIAGR
jgi:hypothetical protein